MGMTKAINRRLDEIHYKETSMAKKRAPILSDVLQCRHCANSAPMLIVATYVKRSEDVVDDGSPEGLELDCGNDYELLECPNCQKIILRVKHWHEAYVSRHEADFLIIFPTTTELPPGLPEKIQKEYSAALKVKSLSPGSYAVLIRRVLELVCRDRNAAGRTLNEQLKDLVKKGEIPGKLADIAHQLRTFGNIGAHAMETEIEPRDIPVLDKLSRALLEFVYSAPFLLKEAAELLAKKNRLAK